MENRTKTETKQFRMKRLWDSMKSTFDMLKKRGLFKEFNNYEDWLAKKNPNYGHNLQRGN